RVWRRPTDERSPGRRGRAGDAHTSPPAFADKSKSGTGEHEPMIWTVAYGKGRVFHTPMGHDAEAIRCVGFVATVQRGTEWAATGKVTLPLPDNFPGPDKPSSLPPKCRARGHEA